MEVRAYLVGTGCLLLPCVSLGPNSGYQAWWSVPLVLIYLTSLGVFLVDKNRFFIFCLIATLIVLEEKSYIRVIIVKCLWISVILLHVFLPDLFNFCSFFFLRYS